MSSNTSTRHVERRQKTEEHLEEILDLDYTLYNRVTKDFREKLDENGFRPEEMVIAVQEENTESAPVLNLKAVEKPRNPEFYTESVDTGNVNRLFHEFYGEPSPEVALNEEYEDLSVEEEYVSQLLERFEDDPVEEDYTLEGISKAAGSQSLRDLCQECLGEIGEADLYYVV